MIDKLPFAPLPADISAVSHAGLRITTADGRPARLAIIDDDGELVAAGPDVAAAAWNVAIASYRQFLIGRGHLRVHAAPAEIRNAA
jgi:hypothetical protein